MYNTTEGSIARPDNSKNLWSSIMATRKCSYAKKADAVQIPPAGIFTGLPIQVYAASEGFLASGFVIFSAYTQTGSTILNARVLSNHGKQTPSYPFFQGNAPEAVALPFFIELGKGWNELAVELTANASVMVSEDSLRMFASVYIEG